MFIGGSYVSGLEISTLHLANALQQDGHEVRCVINGWNDGIFKQKLNQCNIQWYEIKLGWLYIRKPLWTIDTLVHWPAAYLACRKILKDFDPDICHFAGFTSLLMLFPLLKGRNCVYNLQEPHQRTRKHLAIYRLLNKRVKIFTTVSRRIVQMLLDLGIPAEKIRLIYNGVPPIAGNTLKIHDQTIVIGIIGQIVPWKGHETLINAVELLVRSRFCECKVFIFGNEKNEYSAKLKSLIAGKGLDRYFEWKGFLNDQAAIYSQVDVVAVPSLSEEPCSLSILESMMWKKGLIVSDRGGNPELVSHQETGLIFSAEDPDDLARCIRLFLQEPDMIDRMGNEAELKALTQFTIGRMKDEYIDAYDGFFR
jgi:glycosyltransferase involved in cell wall biosynthesis